MKIFTFTDALIIAAESHKGTKDKGGIDYIKHPLHVYHNLKCKGYSNETQMAGLLHDTIEDSKLTIEKLCELGCPESVLNALTLLTHIPNKDFINIRKESYIQTGFFPQVAKEKAKDDEYFEYIKKLSKNDIARAVKIEDLLHNGNIKRAPDDVYENKNSWHRWAKYAQALKILTGGKVGYV